MAKINRNVLKAELAKQAAPILRDKIMPKLEKQFEQAKKQVLKNFEQHAITQELDRGENASNSSGTLRGEGNLHSFIGFDKGENPTAALRELLASKIRIENRVVRKNELVFYIKVQIPSKDEIARVTPLPWAPGRSWAEGIEKGLSGLGNYLVTQSPSSRSGSAVQVKAMIRTASFNNTPYMTQIIEDLLTVLQADVKI
jgi:hypothetical protein